MPRRNDSRHDDSGRSRLGQALRAARLRAGLRQKDLGSRIQRDNSWVSHVEHGRRRPSTEMLVRIAEQLNTLPEELLAAAGKIHPQTREALLALTPAQALRLRRKLQERLKGWRTANSSTMVRSNS